MYTNLHLGAFQVFRQLAPVDGEVEDLRSMATVLWHHVAGAGVPQPQCSVQAAGGHHRRRILPLQVDDAGLRATQMQGDGFRWLESFNSLDWICSFTSSHVSLLWPKAVIAAMLKAGRFNWDIYFFKKGTNVCKVNSGDTLHVSTSCYLMLEAVSQHVCWQVVHSQSAFQIGHCNERQPGKKWNRLSSEKRKSQK